MADLREHREPLLRFIESGLRKFRLHHPDTAVGHIALYCCPWSGWVSLCLNRSPAPDTNCPDFDFVEFAFYGAEEWANEYESDELMKVIDLDGREHLLDIETLGDEAIDHAFFEFLRRLLQSTDGISALSPIADRPLWAAVQMLDSQYNESWQVRK
ncbi:MAG: hypothetical protein H6818_13510 [Phycisphaerales bacterium]|nr:hypothetical protein [Phycisphaerales bacterium]MCB9862181.1 hypothetical protein [Phycisphaerales bacterium]